MSDKPWKAFERLVGDIIGGHRYWANSGEEIDCESERFVVQCKHVKTMSLGAMTRLALQAESDAKESGKVGIVAAKQRLGYGVRTPTLMIMTADEFKRLIAGGNGGG